MKWIMIVILNGQPIEMTEHDKEIYCIDFAKEAAHVYDEVKCVPRAGRNNG